MKNLGVSRFRVVKTVFLETVFLSPTENRGRFDENGENDDLHSTHESKACAPQSPETDENGGCPSDKTRVCQKQGFRHPDRWSPILKSIRVFSVVGLAFNSD